MPFDFLSASIGFVCGIVATFAGQYLLGALTGATGNYLGDKYTDRRREQEARKAELKSFREIEQKMPELITAFRESLKSHPLIREFFVLSSRQVCVGSNMPRFAFYEDENADLRSKIALLESQEFVMEVTRKDTPTYKMTEEFVALLTG